MKYVKHIWASSQSSTSIEKGEWSSGMIPRLGLTT